MSDPYDLDRYRDALAACEKERDALRTALTMLYEETADYIRLNDLGAVHHNRSMRMARAALAPAQAERDALKNHIAYCCKFQDCPICREISHAVATIKEDRDELQDERDALRTALEQSVHFQSHYARLLNMHDGGSRIIFKDADAWLARLAGIIKTEGQKDT